MRIKKYAQQLQQTEKTTDRLRKYQLKNRIYLTTSNGRGNAAIKVNLATLLPLAAAALSPLAIQAQACPTSPSGATSAGCSNAPSGSNTAVVDVDGGGVDFFFTGQSLGLGLQVVGNANLRFAGYNQGGFSYLNNYTSGSVVNSANVTIQLRADGATLTCNSSVVTIDGYASLDYNTGDVGGWAPGTSSTGYMVFAKNNTLGFVEVTWDDDTNEVTIGEFGIATAPFDDPTNPVTSIAVGNCATLPVELTSFKGKVVDGRAKLSWETATEINNEGFEVQRSENGKDFRKIAWIKGAGNSLETINYEFQDETILSNQPYYYRLKQMDFDGTFAYSDMITIEHIDKNQTSVEDIFPNPVGTAYADLVIASTQIQDATINVLDVFGKLIFQKETTLIKGRHTVRLPLANAQAGQHFVQVTLADGTTFFKKLVVAGG
ncbi:MAG: T9SS type A sorting domain-containing protein [Bacteroidota bacterium]